MTELGTISLADEAAAGALGKRLSQLAEAGDVIALNGPLGAGKTVIARGLIVALFGAETEVPSPTYSLIQTYDGPLPVTHADLYRLENPEEVVELGLDEAADGGLLLIEWPSHGEGFLPTPTLTLTAEAQQGEGDTVSGPRRWTLSGLPKWRACLEDHE